MPGGIETYCLGEYLQIPAFEHIKVQVQIRISVCLQSGVELGVFMKKAMHAEGGVPFAKLSPEAICAALRKYETVRSERVALVIKKSAMVGKGLRKSNALVRPTSHVSIISIQVFYFFQRMQSVVAKWRTLPE